MICNMKIIKPNNIPDYLIKDYTEDVKLPKLKRVIKKSITKSNKNS